MQNISPWFVLVLGMSTVFVGLVSLILLTKLMSAAVAKKSTVATTHQKASAPAAAPVAAPAALNIADRKLFTAITAAAIATAMGTEPHGLRIRSIRRLSAGQAGDRGQFVAAVSVALATAMGTEPQGLRIHSIKNI
ncbi:MAG: hypothetical protein EOM66_10030 [Clostridia bacterium]|nr:OadG family protein [Candidatus Pelethousia sp.]NCB31730.1 hypothetical protein [Clostridia bacterium]